MESNTVEKVAVGTFRKNGFAIQAEVYSPAEVAAMLQCIDAALNEGAHFGCPQEVFAIRGLLDEIPELWPIMENQALRSLLAEIFPEGCYVVKAMYFDKPSLLNWRVAWHQDLMINVRERINTPGFGPWTSKPEGVAVQPPRSVLENMCTVRIHLDDCDEHNGALRVVPGSQELGVLFQQDLPTLTPNAVDCPVPAGGAMLMRPLLLHASNRNTTDRPRRVLHLEIASVALPDGLEWRERRPVNYATH